MPTTYTPDAPHTNGVVAMAIKTTEIKLDEIGYTGWVATLRTNPRAELIDLFLSAEQEQSWECFSKFFVSWNFADEEGNPFPLPPETKEKDLPLEVPRFLVNRFLEAYNQVITLPKDQSSNSESS